MGVGGKGIFQEKQDQERKKAKKVVFKRIDQNFSVHYIHFLRDFSLKIKHRFFSFAFFT
jgi:hypothetical protein